MPEILFITSNYIDPNLPNISVDHVTFNKFFLEHRKKANPKYNAVTLNPINKIELRNNILGNYDIIHFSFHGEVDYVQISDTERICHNEFVSLFDDKIKAAVVILNICYSNKLAEEISNRVNCSWVTGWENKVSVEEASDFTSYFYAKVLNNRKPDKVLKSTKEESLNKEQIILSPKNKKCKKISLMLWLLIAIVSLLAILWTVPNKINLNNYKTTDIEAGIDSIKIIYPLNGSIVERWDTVKVTAYLQPNLKPWVFIYSNTKEGWIPQSEGKQIFNNEWQFNVEFGNNLNSTGETRIIACIIDSLTETYCKAWLENHTIPLDDKTFNDHYKKFKADTLTVKIE